MTRASHLIVVVAFLGLEAWAQSSACRTIGIVSDNDHLPAKYLRVQLAFNGGLQDGHFSFVDGALADISADIAVRVRPTVSGSPFRLAARVSRTSTGETREALHPDTSTEGKQRVVQDIVRAILDFCPTPRFQTVVVIAQREPVVASPVEDGSTPESPELTCRLEPVHELSLYSATSSLDERDLRSAIVKDKLARKLNLRAELAPANGAQITVKRNLGTSFWSFSVTTPDGGFCQRDLFILKMEDAPIRLARGIVAVVANSRDQGAYLTTVAPGPRDFKVEAFGGLATVKQGFALVLSVSGKELVITTPVGFEVARIPASALQDVSTTDYSPAFRSDWEADFGNHLAGADPVSATVVIAAATVYATLGHLGSFSQNLFRAEHFLGVAWKDGATVKTASFKVRGRDTKVLRATLESMVEAARFAPSAPSPAGTLLAKEK